MRRYFIAGNWKMHTGRAEAVALAGGIAQRVGNSSAVDVAVCPPAVYLEAVIAAVKGSAVGVGGQNMHDEAKGAFTGEVAGPMLADIGCKYVILGHSERRQFFGDTDAWVNKKLKAALALGLTPIVCVGETLKQRELGQTPHGRRKAVHRRLRRYFPRRRRQDGHRLRAGVGHRHRQDGLARPGRRGPR